ncbi:MAG: GNAT family N-acetyltransferase [Kofleriaceae bacterium]
MAWQVRHAGADDIPAIQSVMDRSIRQLMAEFLAPAAIAASIELMGLDTQLIADGTYFAIDDGERLVGCGGWSRRATLFGGDHTKGRNDALLDSRTEPARVRAMYTDPDYARRGIGRAILIACEAAARADGFRRVELAATLAGEPLYRAAGYSPIEAFEQVTSTGVSVPLIRMGKPL